MLGASYISCLLLLCCVLAYGVPFRLGNFPLYVSLRLMLAVILSSDSLVVLSIGLSLLFSPRMKRSRASRLLPDQNAGFILDSRAASCLFLTSIA